MGDRDDRARVVAQRGLEHLERREVEVVGGLVEQQQLGARRDHRRDRRAGALAGAEAAERPQRGGALEAEVAEQPARLALPTWRASARTRPPGRRPGARPAPCGSTAARTGRSTVAASGASVALEQREQRRLAGAVGPGDRDPVAPVDGQVDAVQQRLAVPAGGHAAQRRHQPPAAAALELDLERARVARLLDVLVGVELASQPPLARLRLLGHLLGVALELRRLGPAHGVLRVLRVAARGADVGLEPPAALLLRLVGELQPRPPAGLLLAVGRVAALVGVQLAAVELEDLRHRRVEEPAVVGDDQHGAGEPARGSSSSHARPSRSRWLVGSSSSSTVGRASSTPASSARAASPPLSSPSGASSGTCAMPSASRAPSSWACSAQPPSAPKRSCASP